MLRVCSSGNQQLAMTPAQWWSSLQLSYAGTSRSHSRHWRVIAGRQIDAQRRNRHRETQDRFLDCRRARTKRSAGESCRSMPVRTVTPAYTIQHQRYYIDDELPSIGRNDTDLTGLLMWQVKLTPFSDAARAIATSVDAVDGGYRYPAGRYSQYGR